MQQTVPEAQSLWQTGNQDMFVEGMGAIALGTQPVQGGNPQGRSEVTVAPPACQRNFPQIEAGRGRNACRCQREACP